MPQNVRRHAQSSVCPKSPCPSQEQSGRQQVQPTSHVETVNSASCALASFNQEKLNAPKHSLHHSVWCGMVWCGVPKALLPKGKGRDVYPRVQVNGKAVCVVCAPCA